MQLCSTSPGLVLAESCSTTQAGLFRIKTVERAWRSFKAEIVSADERYLCARGNAVHLAEDCSTAWDVTYAYPTEKLLDGCLCIMPVARLIRMSFRLMRFSCSDCD